ncbi:MAG TPA: HIT domain-containing protein [Thermoleophilia bacterium]|nr:HIT domain-containing protein [Thermoleophilia bacterium]
MERLWAPWRLEYIVRAKPGGCIFCDKPLAGDDRASQIVWRGTHAYVLLNAFPYNNGHVMIAPFAHLANLEDLPSETIHEMMDLTQLATRAMKRALHPEGLNVGFNLGAAAGAGIKDHLHLHMVPRWSGDTNFMPVIADTRVIPQSLERSWELLTEAFAEVATEH